MQENVELVQQGFRCLLRSLSGFIGQELNRKYKNSWWDEVLRTLNDQYDLPLNGSYGDLVDSLDIANCIRLIDRRWGEDFRDWLSPNCRAWARELMGVRNEVAHIGQRDLPQPAAERALDTMALLCAQIDPESEEEIREIYQEVRARAEGEAGAAAVYTGVAQPAAASVRGALKDGSLLLLVGTDKVQRTELTRKVTYGGSTVVYPVYRVRLDALFYNDQNDRIATWLSRYEAEHGKDSLDALSAEDYNAIIESFIYDSNPESIQKTQKNIALVGQREPGVTLADGRIVDGNRRFTCLRRLQRAVPEPLYFETVIMDMDIRADRKQIKLLELAIQHGEEKKVDYDMIDYAIGTYRDIVQTGLLTVEEYAQSANEQPAAVRRRIEIAEIICEFLAYIRLPEQYFAAREYQVYSLFEEMTALLRQLDEDGKRQLKEIAFNNTMLHAEKDQRKFIRDIKTLIRSDTYHEYFAEQETLGQTLLDRFGKAEILGKEDVERFASEQSGLAEEFRASMERAMLRSRSRALKSKPAENVKKSMELLLDVDPRLFGRLDPDEKENLRAGLEQLSRLTDSFLEQL